MEAERPELIEQILDLDLRVERPADWRVLAGAAAAAAWTDLAFRAGVAGIAGTLLVVVVSAGMLSSGRIINPQARASPSVPWGGPSLSAPVQGGSWRGEPCSPSRFCSCSVSSWPRRTRCSRGSSDFT